MGNTQALGGKHLKSSSFYSEGRDARYILFTYENHLRKDRYGKLPIDDFLSNDSKTRLTIEHIAAQKGSENVSKQLIDISNSEIADFKDVTEFKENYLHHIGNLVIDPMSPNASKGSIPVMEKIRGFLTAPLLSQNELHDDLERNNGKWDVEAIKKRASRLVNFALNEWDEKKV